MPAVAKHTSRMSHRALVPILLVIGVVMLSSLAPFLRFGGDGPTLNSDDVLAAALFVATWTPFLIVGLIVSRRRDVRRLLASSWMLVISVALLPIVTTMHTSLFVLSASVVSNTSSDIDPASFLMLSFLGALQYLAVVALVTAEASGRAAEEARSSAIQLEISQTRLKQQLAELRVAALQAQLQPHFVFNALNSISALVTSDPAGARRMLLDLSTLLRSVLENAEQSFVALDEELRLVRSYLAIQQVRFGDRLAVDFDLDDALQEQPVPPMLLQPLAENAVHHGMSGNADAVRVRIRTSRSDDHLVLEVTNTGRSPSLASGVKGGVGLRNTRARLRLLYTDRFRLELMPSPDGSGAVARVELPLAVKTT